MKRIFATVIFLLISAELHSEEWYPKWQSITFPYTKAKILTAKDPGLSMTGLPVVWVYYIHDKPMPARYFQDELFISEIQEWVVNCSESRASIATIRYTNHVYPETIKKAAITHPLPEAPIPSPEEDSRVCELVT